MRDETREMTRQTQVIKESCTTADSLEFSDIVVYNEMADQTSVKLNLLEQINNQINQLEEMSHKRRFMMKEILQYIVE